jgi:hypothetical protein
MMEHVCGSLTKKRVALFSNNSPTVSWVQLMASRSSLVAKQLIRILALHFKIHKVCPITMLHISGDQNAMTNIPSRSFGSEPKWHFQSELYFLTFFNTSFPLPHQNLWTLCQPTSAIAMRMISILRMSPFNGVVVVVTVATLSTVLLLLQWQRSTTEVLLFPQPTEHVVHHRCCRKSQQLQSGNGHSSLPLSA